MLDPTNEGALLFHERIATIDPYVAQQRQAAAGKREFDELLKNFCPPDNWSTRQRIVKAIKRLLQR